MFHVEHRRVATAGDLGEIRRPMSSPYPVIVVGGGHAGVEAAHAAARLGADVVLLTLRAGAVVRLSCNPAIGGIGKGHLVREIDALGGVMGRAADLAGIHFRVLNRSRGPAVHGPRVQQDHDHYPAVVGAMLAAESRITVVEAEAADLEIQNGAVRGVVAADGRSWRGAAVVVTTGTFLRGLLFQGENETPGGRVGEPPANLLSAALRRCGLQLERFKTGTPPRLLRDSLDFSRFEQQPGDDTPEPFSFEHLEGRFEPSLPQVLTHVTYTNPAAHDVVRGGLDRSPLFTGRIKARGPRYCPSFEDKVVKFSDRERHLLHLEPMGLEHPWIYVNGLSTSLPPEIQDELVASIDGLRDASIARYGYAVEYDYAPPTQLHPTLECRGVRNLFLAGQICGTTGYEEAAGLGIVAGINAGRRACGTEAWVPDRLSSYIGVMVDDLTTRGVLEPYRMFTSRAEVRLSLAADNADRRLTPVGVALGVVPPTRAARARARWERIETALARLDSGPLDGPRPATLGDRVRRGEDSHALIAREAPELSERDRETAVALMRYRGYLERESREVERLRRLEHVAIPAELEFSAVPGLSTEVRERLEQVRPTSLGQAARIPGLTPAAVALLAAAVDQRRRVEP